MKPIKKIKGKLLYKISSSEVLCFKNLAFYIVDLLSGDSSFVASLPVNKWKKVLSYFRLINRLLRLEPKCAGCLTSDKYVICMNSKLWLLDTKKKNFNVITNLRPHYTTLNFCKCGDVLYFGDYGVNRNHDAINIYKLDQKLNLSIVYTFPAGAIRHIHNIVHDKEKKWLWVLTGDNEPESGIYKADYKFKNVNSFVTGEQKYRTVVAFPYKGGLLYATDSVEKENYIYWFEEGGRLTELSEINGSCIYGVENKNYFVFSTTVEPKEGTRLLNMISYKLGDGIKSRDVYIIAVSKKDFSVRVIGKYRKDIWPMKIFQYGRMTFPGGQEKSSDLWAYNIACKSFDGKSFRIEI